MFDDIYFHGPDIYDSFLSTSKGVELKECFEVGGNRSSVEPLKLNRTEHDWPSIVASDRLAEENMGDANIPCAD